MARKALTELMSARRGVESLISRFVPVASRQCFLRDDDRFDILRADARREVVVRKPVDLGGPNQWPKELWRMARWAWRLRSPEQ